MWSSLKTIVCLDLGAYQSIWEFNNREVALSLTVYQSFRYKVVFLQVVSLQSRFAASCPDGTETDFLYKLVRKTLNLKR